MLACAHVQRKKLFLHAAAACISCIVTQRRTRQADVIRFLMQCKSKEDVMKGVTLLKAYILWYPPPCPVGTHTTPIHSKLLFSTVSTIQLENISQIHALSL